jgi:hypothetical protein
MKTEFYEEKSCNLDRKRIDEIKINYISEKLSKFSIFENFKFEHLTESGNIKPLLNNFKNYTMDLELYNIFLDNKKIANFSSEISINNDLYIFELKLY